MKHDDVTLVLQGPLLSMSGKIAPVLSPKKIQNYKKYVGKIVISTWDHHRVKPSKRFLAKNDIDYVEDSIDKYEGYYNHSNLAYQAATSLNGIELVDTEFVIKARCDEIYTDLSKFIEVMKSSPDKLTTNNFLFTSDEFCKFHPSDHVIGGKTEDVKGLFNNAVRICEKSSGKDNPVIENYDHDGLAPESFLFICYLIHKGVDIDNSRSIEIMKDNCQLVEITDMGSFLCYRACVGYNEYDKVLEDTATITSMDDL